MRPAWIVADSSRVVPDLEITNWLNKYKKAVLGTKKPASYSSSKRRAGWINICRETGLPLPLLSLEERIIAKSLIESNKGVLVESPATV